MVKYYTELSEAILEKIKEIGHNVDFHFFEKSTSPEDTHYYCLTNDELDVNHENILLGRILQDYNKLPENIKLEFKRSII